MITANPYNGKQYEHSHYDDILENAIKLDTLNASPLEIRLAVINKGSKRRQRNNHADRLAKFKQSI